MWINNFDWLILVDTQPEFFNFHPLVNEVVTNIKKNIFLAMENNLPIFILTKRSIVKDWKWVIVWDDSEYILDWLEEMILKRNYNNVYYFSKEWTSLFEKDIDWNILDINDLKNVENLFSNINSPLISWCFTLACEFAVARDLIDNWVCNPTIHYNSSIDWLWMWDKNEINSHFSKYWYDNLLLDKNFEL